MQTAAGLACVAFGVIHFLDRGRPHQEVRQFFLGSPRTEVGRGALAVLEVLVGFALLFVV